MAARGAADGGGSESIDNKGGKPQYIHKEFSCVYSPFYSALKFAAMKNPNTHHSLRDHTDIIIQLV